MPTQAPAPPALHRSRPGPTEHDPYYSRYIERVPAGMALEMLVAQQEEVPALLAGLDDAAALHRYAPEKWSVKEVVGHLCDVERIFCYRALRAARADATPLPGFDENTYVPAGAFDGRSLGSLVAEWKATRAATVAFFDGLAEAAWLRMVEANGAPASVRALAYITAGHTAHHLAVLRERYGLGG